MPERTFLRTFLSNIRFETAKHRRISVLCVMNGDSFEKASYQYDNPQAPTTK